VDPNNHPLLTTITDRTGTITHVNRLVRKFLGSVPGTGGHQVWLNTARFEWWVIRADAKVAYVPLQIIPPNHICVASDLSLLKTEVVSSYASQQPPEHILDLAQELADIGGHPVCLDGPHSRTFPFDIPAGASDPGPFEWRIGFVRDRTNHVLAMVGDPGRVACGAFTFTFTAWARELDETGERTRRYAQIPPPQRVESLASDIANILLDATLVYQ
jgi:hypothetical protein